MDNPKKLRTLSLCTGYGGIERGIESAGQPIDVVAHVEIEAFAAANLVAKMEAGELGPCPIWTDLKTLPLRPFRDTIDLITGGFPCQPFSQAGSRAGDEDPRHLFPYILRIIEECRPGKVFLENVEGIVSAKLKGNHWRDPEGTPVLLHVLRELERRGYQATWGIFSAEECGAPHRRKRVFILANSNSEPRSQQAERRVNDSKVRSTNQTLADAFESRLEGFKHLVVSEKIGRKITNGPIAKRCHKLANPNSSGSGEDKQQTELRSTGVEQSSKGTQCGFNQTQTEQIQRWPARPGQRQHEWEALRTTERGLGGAIDGPTHRVDRLRLLGNGVVGETARLAWSTLS